MLALLEAKSYKKLHRSYFILVF